jgi:Zn-finger nucleic acid-binding protein
MDRLTCPKCGSPWRSFERSGITVDQCTGCRGVFLDRGELERLIDAETRYSEGRSYARAEELGYADRYRERYPRHGDDDEEHRYGFGHGHRRHRERGGFLEDFFGGDD